MLQASAQAVDFRVSRYFGEGQEMLGVDGFSKIVCETSTLSLPNMKQELIDRVAAWRSGPAADDMSLVVVGIS
jgi:hypothetical protein